MKKLYRQKELTDEQLDTYVFAHQMAMTSESLHSKVEIAAELGARDIQIAELEANQARAEILILELHNQVYDKKYLDNRVSLYFSIIEQSKGGAECNSNYQKI